MGQIHCFCLGETEPRPGMVPKTVCQWPHANYIFLIKEIYYITEIPITFNLSATTYCPSGITDVHSQQRKKNYKNKFRYSDLFLKTSVLTPLRQHQESSFFKTDLFKKGTMHKKCRRPITDLGFSP
jgi:hypothetical protein